jgi:hypothetical protein
MYLKKIQDWVFCLQSRRTDLGAFKKNLLLVMMLSTTKEYERPQVQLTPSPTPPQSTMSDIFFGGH